MVWPLNKRLVMWIIGAVISTVIVLLILGSIGAWLWGVLSAYIQPKTPTDKKDLVNIFVLIAAGLVGTLTALAAVGNLYFSRKNLQNARETLQQQRVLDDQRAQDEAIQDYLQQMTKLMRDKDAPLRSSRVGDEVREVRTLARSHTLTLLRRLYPDRKRNVLNFLYEANLIKGLEPIIDLGSPDFESSAADLSGADLRGAVLRLVWLSGRYRGANLSGADLRGADLRGSDLIHTTLRGADLSGANLSWFDKQSNLVEADLRGAYLIGTDFSGAILRNAKLSGAHFRRAEGSTQQYADELKAAGLPDEQIEQAIRGQTNLTEANLRGAEGVTNEQLEQHASSLEGTIMPDGTIHAGRYVTSPFEIAALSFIVGDGWRVPRELEAHAPDAPSFIEDAEGGQLLFTIPGDVFDPSIPSELKKLRAPEKTNEWVSWFESHPNLDTSEPVEMSVGYWSGMQIEVTTTSAPRSYPRDYCERPCVPLYTFSFPPGILSVEERSKHRFVIIGVSVGGSPVVIDISAPEDKFDVFLPKAQKVLDTVEWDSALGPSSE